ncbi:MAG: hypothetical protein M1819_005546 [Sarea resinae]|nr:MAG: hypothetical protein M1819_005546 [Sarea resinae]
MRIPLFRIFYSTSFTILLLILIVLLIVTPGDTIHQALSNDQIYYVFIIAAVYFVTVVLAVLIYASRLYTNRSVLAAIPKAWVPIEKEDVGHSVRRMIAEGLSRSALVAWDARPRDLSAEGFPEEYHQSAPSISSGVRRPSFTDQRHHHHHYHHGHLYREGTAIRIPRLSPVWGPISHPGWSSPSSPDLPNLHYNTVIYELPHLIEAKAVSLAPLDPTLPPPPPDGPPTPPDPRAVALLQRPATMSLRDYLAYLTNLDLIDPPELAADFLAAYERARFSSKPSTEEQFRDLMHIFAEILRRMTTLDPAVLNDYVFEEERYFGEEEFDSTFPDNSTERGRDRDGDVYEDGAASIPSQTASTTQLHLPLPYSYRTRSRSSSPLSEHSTTSTTGTIRTAPSYLTRNFHTPTSIFPRTPSSSSLSSLSTTATRSRPSPATHNSSHTLSLPHPPRRHHSQSQQGTQPQQPRGGYFAHREHSLTHQSHHHHHHNHHRNEDDASRSRDPLPVGQSEDSSDASSVIRLRHSPGPDDLPYEFALAAPPPRGRRTSMS